MTEVCSCCKTIPGRRSRPRPPKSATAADIVIETAMKTRKGTFWRPQGPLIKMCEVFLDATFHGGSNDTIGGRGRLRRPEISPIYPFNFLLSLAAPHLHGVLVLVTGNKFIPGVVVTGDNSSPVPLSPATKLSPVSLSPATSYCRCRCHR